MSPVKEEREAAGEPGSRASAREIERRLVELALPWTMAMDPNATVEAGELAEMEALVSMLDPELMSKEIRLAFGSRGSGFGLPLSALAAIEAGMSAGGWRRRELFERRLEAWEQNSERLAQKAPGPAAAAMLRGSGPCPGLMRALRDKRALREAEAIELQTRRAERSEAGLRRRL